jgi:metallo-beta-lactamase family protein
VRTQARAVVIGGGVGGASILYWLARLGWTDVALVESTYGNRSHESGDEALDKLAGVITRTAGRGGVVVIPAFAVDRTEVVLHALSQLRRAGRVPDLPVHVDSPMALAVLRVYQDAVTRDDPELRPGLKAQDPFDAGELHAEKSRDESKALNDLHDPAIIISSSGMATGGRVVHHLVQRLPDARNAVVLVGYQAEGTRGRQLAEGAPTVKMFGHDVPVRAEVTSVDAFSVHADADELVDWVRPAPTPSAAFLVHGEEAGSTALRDRLATELHWPVTVPALGDIAPLG